GRAPYDGAHAGRPAKEADTQTRRDALAFWRAACPPQRQPAPSARPATPGRPPHPNTGHSGTEVSRSPTTKLITQALEKVDGPDDRPPHRPCARRHPVALAALRLEANPRGRLRR